MSHNDIDTKRNYFGINTSYGSIICSKFLVHTDYIGTMIGVRVMVTSTQGPCLKNDINYNY